jgi:ferredoxin
MKTAPLLKTGFSNERIMTALFAVTLLWLLPRWIATPTDAVLFLAVLVPSLVLDAAISLRRYGMPACAVSAAVTVGIFWVPTAGTGFIVRAAGAAAALILGKQVWGGAGKNPLNPAALGIALALIVDTFASRSANAPFAAEPATYAAALLSIPFLVMRPFAGASFFLALLAAEAVPMARGALSLRDLAHQLPAFLFWSCLVVTDPATVTRRPLAGAAAAFAAGSLAASLGALAARLGPGGETGAFAVSVLLLNLTSVAMDRRRAGKLGEKPLQGRMRERKLAVFTGERDFTPPFSREKIRDTSAVSGEELVAIAQGADLYGLGGGAFPTAEKLRAALASTAAEKHLVVNAVECDPGLVHDRFLLERSGEDIESGIRLLSLVLPAASVSLVVAEAPLHDYSAVARVITAKPRYPAGAERIIIRELLGRELAPSEIPAKGGVLLLNVQTVLALYEAAAYGRKADGRWISVADLAAKKATAVRVPLGMEIAEIVSRCGLAGAGRTFVGGGAMQGRLAAEGEVVGPRINLVATGKVPRWKEAPQCFRCGRCAAVCPASLQVDRIVEGGLGATPADHLKRCLQCGACSSVCLAGRNLSAAVKELRETALASS